MLVRFLFGALVPAIILTSTACSQPPSCPDCGGSGGGGGAGGGGSVECTQSVGILEGDVFELGSKRPLATIILRTDPMATPLHGEADETGHYKIELSPGTWLVGAETASNCLTAMDVSVEITACETTVLDLHADECFDG